jgi:hypothetical protein
MPTSAPSSPTGAPDAVAPALHPLLIGAPCLQPRGMSGRSSTMHGATLRVVTRFTKRAGGASRRSPECAVRVLDGASGRSRWSAGGAKADTMRADIAQADTGHIVEKKKSPTIARGALASVQAAAWAAGLMGSMRRGLTCPCRPCHPCHQACRRGPHPSGPRPPCTRSSASARPRRPRFAEPCG